MARPLVPSQNARKQPVQARSQATVDAIFQATVQVLLRDGPPRLTTTRVAERAGVSVGTLYQYFPNKQALCFALLQQHLGRVADAVEAAARSAHHAPLERMVDTLVAAFVASKLGRIDEARALYGVASQLDAIKLVRSIETRARQAIAAMLATAADARFEDIDLTASMFSAALAGPTRAILEGGAPPKMIALLPAQLKSLALGYLRREALPR